MTQRHFDHALITGASRGLGRALAERLAAHSTAVSLVARGAAPLAEAVAQIRDAGGRATSIAADVGHPDAAVPIAGRAVDANGPVDLVIHAASALGPVPLRPLVDTHPDQFVDTFAVNVIGPYRLTRALLPCMLLARRGTILAVSSDAAVEPYPTWGAYGASKAALDHLMRIWAAELEDTGVRALAVDPGEMDTQMHADAIPDADRSVLGDPRNVAAWIHRWLTRDDQPSPVRWVAQQVAS